jgi:hypothetical protein
MSYWFGIIGFLLLVGVFFGKIGWGWGLLGALLLFSSGTRFWTKYKAASNAIIARYTYHSLSEREREMVLASVTELMSTAQYPIKDPEEALRNMSPEQKYGFFALGMAHVGIAPKIGDGWYAVSNPYAEILGAQREIAWVKHQIRLKHGVDIAFEENA